MRHNLTTDQQAVLEAEMQADPLGRGYAAMDEGAVLADMLDCRYPGAYRVTIVQVASQCGSEVSRRLAASLQAAAAVDPLVLEMLEVARGGDGIDLNHDETRVMLAEFAANESLPYTADDNAAVLALCDNRTSRLDVLRLPTPRLREIRNAKGGAQ